MRRSLQNIFHLGLKELASVRRDRAMMVLIVWAFTGAIYLVASGANTEMRDASVGFLDQDRSRLSNQIRDALQGPTFAPPVTVAQDDVDRAMEGAWFTFVIAVPPRFESDLLAGRRPQLQLLVDATAMAQAGVGTSSIAEIVNREVSAALRGSDAEAAGPIDFTVRSFFNPNLEDRRHSAVMEIVNNVCLLSIILVGAAVVREREHGTIEHLLVMPVTPTEIILAKIWANGLVVLIAVFLSLNLMARGLLGVPVNGSVTLFLFGAVAFLFATMALGVMLATLTPSMPQFALLAFPAIIVMEVLSGGMTPLESMPAPLQLAMSVVPSTHYVQFAQSVLFRGASLAIVWPQIAFMAGLGLIYVAIALMRFRSMLSRANGH